MQALDGRTGRLLWEFRREGRQGAQMRSLAAYADLIFLNTADGHVVGLDARTGAQRWDSAVASRGGGDAWIPGSYDPMTRLVYWGTAQAKPWSRAARGTDGDALYTNSTLALDAKTGEIKWYFQHTPGESFDLDEVFERILIDHGGRSSVFSMGKMGILWELDRKTGKFVRATDLGYQTLVDINLTTGRATYRKGVLELQRTGKEIFFCPSTGGVKALRAMAYHPDTRALYVPLNVHCVTSSWRSTAGPGAGWKVQRYHFHEMSPDQLGELIALDAATGKALWRQRRRAPYNTSALTTAGGLVFVGTWDRSIFAYDAKTGAELWQAGLPTMANGSPISYAVDGKQYVVFGAGASIGGSTWVDLAPVALLPELRNPRVGNRHVDYANGIFVFTLPRS